MPLDPNIILRGFNPPPLDDPLQTASRAFTLKNQMMQSQQAQAQMEQAKRQYLLQDEFRKAVGGLPANATSEDYIKAARPYLGPEDMVKLIGTQENKKLQLQQQAEAARDRIERSAQNNELMHEYRMGRLKSEEDRAAEIARHNRAQEAIAQQGQALNAGLRRMGIEMQAQGLELRRDLARQKVDLAQAQDLGAANNITANMDRMAQEANRLLKHPGLSKVTGIRSWLPLAGGLATVPGTDAANFKAGLETLKSQVGFSVLQAMRDAAKTGGALGQVSDFENRMLQSNLAALDAAQDEGEFKAALEKIIKYTEDAKGRVRKTLNMKYGASQSTAARKNNEVPGDVDANLWNAMTPEEKALWRN